MWKVKCAVFALCLLWAMPGWSIEIYLKNGDKISGVISGEDDASIRVKTLAAGELRISRAFIDLPKTFPEKYAPPNISPQDVSGVQPQVIWKKDLSFGYTQVGGNAQTRQGQLSTSLDRKTSANETTVKYTANYAATNRKMNDKKFYGLLRYAHSFGADLKWYNFYKMEGNQDYFAGIEYRLNPSTGVGYWFSNTDSFKAMTELGIGYQYTHYRVSPGPDEGGEPVLVPRFFIDKRLIGNLHVSEDFTFYPSLDNFNNYHFRSETDLVNQITKHWSFKISYTDDFNSAPPPGFKKQDYTWLTALECHF